MNPPDARAPVSASLKSSENTRICAVTVTYNPDSTLEENIRALVPEVDKLIVVDNGSEPPIRASIAALASACGFEVVWNDENMGLAKALNVGIGRALASSDSAWIATFDHDSKVEPGFRDAMLGAFASCPFRDKVAMIGPRLLMRPDEGSADDKMPASPFVERKVILQSGCLIKSEILRNAGMFDESFFIDYVDFEYCLRLRRKGFRIIEATNAFVSHRVGAPSLHKFLHITCMVSNHSPIRRYYAARNRLRVYYRYWLSDFRWICHDAWSWFKELIKLLLFEQDRRQKLAYSARGVWDALRGRSGELAKGAPIQR